MGAPKQTIGYHYLFSMLFGIGRGPIDELRAIKVGDKIAWEGHACEGVHAINNPELFGGEKKEGGVQGLFRLNQGQADQVLPGAISQVIPGSSIRDPYPFATLPDLKALVASETGGEMGELRGRVTLWFDGLVTSMNPYIKEWRFRVRRAQRGWAGDVCWYPEKAIIFLAEGRIFAMNPAHIIYECCTNPAWGRGASPALINENSFTLAANSLCAEGFGLCLTWYRKEEIGEFIRTVLDHIGATLYTDRETGQITLKLIRDDYTLEEIPVFSPSSGLLDIQEDDSGSSDTGVSEVIVAGHDPILDEAIEMRAHNLAAFRALGSVSTLDQSYPGLPTKELCARVAQRDLRASAAGLRKFRVVLDRRGFRIHPGAVFRIQAPTRGIADVVLRAGEIDDGRMADGRITISAVQDVFGLPATSFVRPVENIWTPPSDVAVPAEDVALIEASFRRAYLARSPAEAEAVRPGEGFITSLVGRPSTRSQSYDMLSRATGETDFVQSGDHFFTGTALLAADISAIDTAATVEMVNDFPAESLVGAALLIGDEIARIEAYDEGTLTFTLARGAEDTWPAAHVAGERVWLVDDDPASDGRQYAEGETVEAKFTPRTFSDRLNEDDADLLTIELAGRVARPYPPADVKVDGDSIFALSGEYPEPMLSWVERNRLVQGDVLIGFFEAGMAAEPGTTYTVRVYEEQDSLSPLGTHTGVTSGWQYTTMLQTADGAEELGAVWMELVSVRDSTESWSPQRFRIVLRSGWGYEWDFNWGG